jgi:transcriptional regulator with XRE-family HTH domain
LKVNIKKYRDELNISQKELARRIGVDQSYISKLEHDEISHASFMVIERIAKELGTCPYNLILFCSYCNRTTCKGDFFYKSP